MNWVRANSLFLVPLIVAASLFHYGDAAKAVPMRWAQDKDSIFFTVSVDCASNKVFAPKENIFDLTCKKKSGEMFSLTFELREAIKPVESTCKSVRGEEECKLPKLHSHFFDRLTRDADLLKQSLKPDWSKWKDEDESQLQQEDNYEGESDVKSLTAKQVEEEVQKGAVVIADIYFPWCTHCSYTRKAFISAAKTLSSEKHLFARIDAREDYDSSSRFNITCDYKCNFHVLQKDESPALVAAKANEADMVAAFKPYFSPSVTILTSEDDLAKFKKSNPVFALALLKGKGSDEFKALQKAAQSLRGKLSVAFSETDIGGFKAPSIQVFGNSSDARSVTVSSNDTELARWLLLESLPTLDQYTWQKRELYDGLGLPVVHVFIDEKSSSAKADAEMITAVASEFRGKLSFVQFKKADDYMLKDFGLPDTMPAVGIALNFSYNSPKYGFEGSVGADAIRAFLASFLDGKLSPSYKSEPAPSEESKPGKVRTVVWKTLHKVVGDAGADAKEEVLLMVYKPWSQNRDKAQAVLDKVAAALEDVPGFAVASIDASKNHVDTLKFPTGRDEDAVALFLCRGDGSAPERFSGAVTQKDLLKFVAKKVAAVKASWETSVKAKLKKMKEEEAEKKRIKAEEEKAEAEKKAEELKKMDELVAKAEKVDVGEKKDGGIIKQVITAGQGSSPSKGEKVRAHYTGTLLDGTKFDSSRDRGDPFSFTLGQGQVIPCWDQSFATMTKGERAMLTCTAPYAYGERGSPPKIPPGATLRFDVELLGFGKDEL